MCTSPQCIAPLPRSIPLRCSTSGPRVRTTLEFILVAETAAGVVAFGSIVPQLRELRAVYVHPDAGRRGIGSQVLGELERLALESGVSQLHVDASINSEAFYQRAGYEVVGRGLHGFRTGHEMACVKMVKNLQ